MVPTASATGKPEAAPGTVNLPAPTAWPIVLAFGVTLLFAGLLTSASVSTLGAILMVTGCVGWFRDVLPHEKEETVEVREEVTVVSTSRREVERLPMAPDLPRPLLPLEIYPVSAGIRGGLAGSVAMAVLACLYGLLKQRSIWYPINLLASTASAQSFHFDVTSLSTFHLTSFSLAVVIHLTTSLLVGLLYGAMLPMFPRRPILLGGVIAPILWTGLLHSILGLINPLLDARIDWPWFIGSQFAFGIVAGSMVARQERLRTRQFEPFLVRAGIEAAGLKEEKPNRNGSR
jgi:membrane-associated protease RseP (regulator of RpoE activity)